MNTQRKKIKTSKLSKGILAIVVILTMIISLLPSIILPLQAKMDTPVPLYIYLSQITDAKLVSKIFDDTTYATVESYGTIPSDELINGATDVHLAGGMAVAYDSANVGTTTGIIVGASLVGADASKYALSGNVLYAAGLITQAEGVFPSPTPVINAAYTVGTKLANISLPDGYAWAEPEAAVTAGANQQIAATYTDPSKNYTAANGFVTLNAVQATAEPSAEPTGQPTATPSLSPTIAPNEAPSAAPRVSPTVQPSTVPTNLPSTTPSTTPSASPSPSPTVSPSPTPTTPALITDNNSAYMEGYPGGYFNPDGQMTRAEVAVMFDRLLVKDAGYTTTYQGMFTDVPSGSWFAVAVENLARLGIINGRGSNWFDPDAPITRAEFAAIATRLKTVTAASGAQFADVTSDDWFYNAVNSAAAAGWVTGYPDGTFHPNDNITRTEAAVIVNRVLEREFDSSLDGTLTQFSDVPPSYWGYDDIMEATNANN